MGDEDGLSVRDNGQGGGVAPAIDSPRGRPHAVLVDRADAVEVEQNRRGSRTARAPLLVSFDGYPKAKRGANSPLGLQTNHGARFEGGGQKLDESALGDAVVVPNPLAICLRW